MKKVLVIALVVFLALTPSLGENSAFATTGESGESKDLKTEVNSENTKKFSEEKLDKILLKNLNYPEEYVEELPLEVKQDMVANNAVYVSHKKTNYTNDEGNGFSEITSDTFSALGTIPASDFTFTQGVSFLGTKDGKKRYTIYAYGIWDVITFWNLVDKQGLSYSSDFTSDPYTDGGYSCSHYTKDTRTSSWVYSDSCGGRTGSIGFSGASWHIDKKAGYFSRVYTKLNVQQKVASSGTTPAKYGKFIVEYAHDTSSFGTIGVNWNWVQVGYNSGSSADYAAQEKSWVYY